MFYVTGFEVPKPTGIGFNTNQGSSPSASFGTFGSAKTSSFQPWPQTKNVTDTQVVQFQPLNGTDTLTKNGQASTVNTRQYCITAMKEYEGKILEELRFRDYSENCMGQVVNGIADGVLLGTTHDDSIARVPTP